MPIFALCQRFGLRFRRQRYVSVKKPKKEVYLLALFLKAFYRFRLASFRNQLNKCAMHFNQQKLFVRHVFTHKEYDKWKQ